MNILYLVCALKNQKVLKKENFEGKRELEEKDMITSNDEKPHL